MAFAGSLEAQWRAQASQLLGTALRELQLLLARQGKLRRTMASDDPFVMAAYALSGLLLAGQASRAPHTPQRFYNYLPSAATTAWLLR